MKGAGVAGRRRPVKVGHLVLALHVGGLERFVIDLIDHSSEDFEHSIICLEEKGAIGAALGHIPIRTLGKKPGFNPAFSLNVRRALKEEAVEVVHSHNLAAQFYGALAVMGTGMGHVNTKHGRNEPHTRNKRLLNQLACLWTHKVAAVSADALEVAIDVEKTPPGKAATILNGVDCQRFQKRAVGPASLDGGSSVFNIVCVARLSEIKNHALLLDACALLQAEGVPFRLSIVGDGPLQETLRAQADRIGIAPYTVFEGMRDDVENALQGMDVFVLPSLSEGVSLTLLEAMAAELPVIATDVGGNPEVVTDGVTGFLVPSGDSVALCRALKALWAAPDRRRAFGEKGRERVLRDFDINETVRQYEKIYRELL